MEEQDSYAQPKDYGVLLQVLVVAVFVLGMIHVAMQRKEEEKALLPTPTPTPTVVEATPMPQEEPIYTVSPSLSGSL